MTGDEPDRQEPGKTPEGFDRRLKAAVDRAADAKRAKDDATRSGISAAFRIGVELVAGVVVGVAIGWALDKWLNTAPWLMVLFFFLGSAAGMMNVYRTMSGIGHGVGYRRDDGDSGGTNKE